MKEKITGDLNQTIRLVKENLLTSFKYIKENPEERKEVINIWREYIKKLWSETTNLSEKYQEKGIVKAITKVFMFGR
ncbi:hypothetical protein MWH28_08930 [Natroniella sulfidigena]|uniref:hypothetical protein n=1 Tax=Natroniella sulfidigena TaxID=723921 RepID=UPI002009F06F|nr:hypothetical protein [Natroniella sulfidigena]MCK8817478.1 hypothetical protein [Natroniella sulfidigena]